MSRLIGNIRYTLFEQAILSTHVFVTLAFIRHLGPEQYGVYNYYLSVSGIVSILTFGGFNGLYVREVARTQTKGAITSSLLLLNCFGALLSCGALWIYYLIYKESDRLSPVLMAFTMLSTFNCLRSTLQTFFIARQNVRLAFHLTVGTYIFSTAIKIAAILTNQPIQIFFFLIAVDTLISIAVYGTAYGWREIFVFDGTFEKIRFYFKNGWPLLITSLSILVFMKIDQVMVFHMRTEREAGSYASMIWLIDKTFIFIGIVMTAFFPYLSAQYASDRAQYLKAVRVGHKLFSIVAVPIMIFLIPNRAAVVSQVFGPNFSANSNALIFLASSILFVYWGAINQKVLVVTNALKLDLFYAGSSAILNVALNYLLIPRYGTLGASVAMLASHSFYFWIQFFIRDYRNYNAYMLLSLPVPLIAACLALLLSRTFAVSIIYQSAIYLTGYAILIILALRIGISDEYATLYRLLFTKAIRQTA